MLFSDIIRDGGVEETTEVGKYEQYLAATMQYDLSIWSDTVSPETLAALGLSKESLESVSLSLEIVPCEPVAKSYTFSKGICNSMFTGEGKAALVCAECGSTGDASPWFRPYFVADCDTPICLDCASSLLDMSEQK